MTTLSVFTPRRQLGGQRFILLWERPQVAGLLALMGYLLLAFINDQQLAASKHPYFNYLADAFLHGQFDLRILPTDLLDLSVYQGRYYLYWQPLPAVLLMPLVKLMGVFVSDITFTAIIAGVNVGLVAWLLQLASLRRIVMLSRLQRAWITLFFAFGTVHVTLVPTGGVWYTAQIVGFCLVTCAYCWALWAKGPGAFWGLGCLLAGAHLTRSHLVLVGLWPICYLLQAAWSWPRQRLILALGLWVIPIVGALGLTLGYNWARFGNVFETGLSYVPRMNEMFPFDYAQYGAFNLYYVPRNFYYQYLFYPFPFTSNSWLGGSLFLLSPVFLGAGWGLYRFRHRWSVWVLLLTMACVTLPSLLLMGPGTHFGPRYTLDFTAPLLLLTAMGIRRWRLTVLILLVFISIVHYLAGTGVIIQTF
jgi:hypothetical protein